MKITYIYYNWEVFYIMLKTIITIQIEIGGIMMLSMPNMDLEEFNKWECKVKKNVYSFEVLCNLIKDGYDRKHGGIVLNPDYQREYKFKKPKESSIIESLLLSIPIPVIGVCVVTEQKTAIRM